MSRISDEQFSERQGLFEDFLTSDRTFGPAGERNYQDSIRAALKARSNRLMINIDDLREANADVAANLLRAPLEWLAPLQTALTEVTETILAREFENLNVNSGEKFSLRVGLEGSFGALHTTPRHLATRLLSHIVCLDGIVTSCSLIRPKLVRSVHFNEEKQGHFARDYRDTTMIDGDAGGDSSSNYPTTVSSVDSSGQERLSSEFGLSSYRDHQTLVMQEMPEKSPAGQLPRAIDVVLEEDLVDSAKPGDRVRIVGIYKSLASISGGGQIPAHFKSAVVALSVKPLISGSVERKDENRPEDIKNFKSISRRKDVFELLSASLAPSIYGHDFVKKAVLLQLLGGVEKNLANGAHLRGDINLMLVGDPSTAKSQMLRFVLSLAPLAIATTGRGSSGVGLTAAVTSDRETGERRLEAGAMVLADRGIVCIDEFDKMSDSDRVAIHEVMEQQTVTIAKAGIHVSLNARCSVLAAANPIWGQYRETASPQENIRLPDSLLSRFDLLFIILDTSTPEHDSRIAKHVLTMHRHLPPGLAEGEPIHDILFDPNAEDSVVSNSDVFQKRYSQESTLKTADEDADDLEDDEILNVDFVKRYIAYAKSCKAPELTRSACEHIVAAYTDFRQRRNQDVGDGNVQKTFPVTPRTLETLIRLASAHAKARLSTRVERKDARIAQELLEYCLYKEVKKKPKTKRRRQVQESSSNDSDISDDELIGAQPLINMSETKTSPLDDNQFLELSLDSNIAGDSTFKSIEDCTTVGDSQIHKQLLENSQIESPYSFVDPSLSSQLCNSVNLETSAAIRDHQTSENSAQETVITQDHLVQIRSKLNRLRSASMSTVFHMQLDDLFLELLQPSPSNDIKWNRSIFDSAISRLSDENQVMVSDGCLYII